MKKERLLSQSVWNWIKDLIRGYWPSILFILNILSISSAIGMVTPLLWARIIDDATMGSINYAYAAAFFGLVLWSALPFTSFVHNRLANRYFFPIAIFVFYVGLTSPLVAAFMVIFGICFGIINKLLGQKLADFCQKLLNLGNDINTRMREVVANIELVKLQRSEQFRD